MYVDTRSIHDKPTDSSTLFAFNSTPFARRDLIKISIESLKSLSEEVEVQIGHDGSAYVLLEGVAGEMVSKVSQIKSNEAVRGDFRRALCVTTQTDLLRYVATTSGDDHILSNAQLEVKINSSGRITSILDKALDRQLILAGQTAGFVIFEDRPLNWSAWDVDIFHLETKSDIDASSVKIIEDGPFRATVLATYHFGSSVIKVRLCSSLRIESS